MDFKLHSCVEDAMTKLGLVPKKITPGNSTVWKWREQVVFLDIDGVLWPYYDQSFNQECLNQLSRIIKTTKAQIVLSSSWRLDPKSVETVNEKLTSVGLSPIISTTPKLHCRSAEILQWLEDNKNLKVEKWVILDDMDLFLDKQYADRIKDNFVRTDIEKGLTKEDADKAIKLLKTGWFI